MSPVFRHGGLRLYLLKLLDEAPRHGYDVIRLLQDKFLGVYSPSPGTIYPRLARLEEEGLVTHETVDGKKVYKITEAGRAELNRRLDDLADLEDELAASVRDIAREISRDVRETVRNLRDELTFAVREAGRDGSREAGRDAARDAGGDRAPDTTAPVTDSAGGSPSDVPGDSPSDVPAGSPAGAQDSPRPQAGAWRDATSEDDSKAEPTASSRTDATDHASAPGAGRASDKDDDPPGSPGPGERDKQGAGDWREWADFTHRGDWRDFADWAKRQGWGDWVGKQEWKDRARSSRAEWTQPGRPDWLKGGRSRDRGDAGPDLMSGLEHLAAAFSREIRGVARQAEDVSDDALGNLGKILSDTLNKIRSEVFRDPDQHSDDSGTQPKPDDGESTGPRDSSGS